MKDTLIYALESSGTLQVSGNLGQTWNILSPIPESSSSLCFNTINNMIYSPTSKFIYRSDDGGKSWGAILKPGQIKTIQELAIAGSKISLLGITENEEVALFLSHNEGESREKEVTVVLNYNTSLCVGQNCGFFVLGGKIYWHTP